MKKYSLIYVVTSLILISLLAIFNYLVDPSYIFSSNYEKRIALEMLKKKNVADVSNLDERLLQKFYTAAADKSNVIAIGSSRSMLIRSHHFKNQSFHNSSVSGAVLEDFLAIYRLYEKNNICPDVLVLGFDPWILNGNNTTSRWQSLKIEFSEMSKILDSNIEINNDFLSEEARTLVSLPYLLKSISSLLEKEKKNDFSKELPLFEGEDCETGGLRWDGSRAYTRVDRERSIESINANASDFAGNDPVYSLGDFHELSQTRSKLIENFIDHLQKKNIQVVVYLPPYHPIAYEKIIRNDRYKIIKSVERYFHQLAKEKKIKIIGSYDSLSAQCANEDFIDALHPNQSGIDKIFSTIEIE